LDAQKSKKRPRVSKYIESGKAHFPRVYKDIQELAYQSKKFPTMKTLNDVNKKNDVKSKAAEEVKAEPEKIDFSKVKIEPLFEEAVDFDTFSKSDFRAVKVKECVAVPKSKKLLQFTLDDGTGTDRTILSGIHSFYEPEELVGKTLIAITNLPPRAMMGIDSCGMLLSAIHEEEGEEKLHLLMVDDHIPAGAKLY
jgi:methionine--tRNA ligase beta chain